MAVTLAQVAPLSGSSGQVVDVANKGVYRGYNLRETTGSAAAVVELHEGSSTNGRLLATIDLPQGTSQDVAFILDQGAMFSGGIWLQLVSGTMPAGFVRYSGV